MKKLYLFSALFLSFCLFAACFAPLVETGERVSEDELRLHILATSDTKADQDLKVRDDVLQACTFFSDFQSVTEAQQAAENNLQRITEIARQRIRQEGYNYQVTARVVREYFNTRVYENVTLPAGYYNALKIEIGAGAGHNWWCVLFPQMCIPTAVQPAAEFSDEQLKVLERRPQYEPKFALLELFYTLTGENALDKRQAEGL